jgi:hypothetical protein
LRQSVTRMTQLLSIPGAFLFPRAFLRIWRTSSVRSRTFFPVLRRAECRPRVRCPGSCAPRLRAYGTRLRTHSPGTRRYRHVGSVQASWRADRDR